MELHAFRSVLERALDARIRIAEPGRDASPGHVDAWYDMQIGDVVWPVALERKSSSGQAIKRIRSHQLALQSSRPNVIPILAVPRLSRRERQMLRKYHVNFVDLSGNISIRSPSLVVAIEGMDGRLKDAQRRSGRNPFSKKASLVARVLLAQPARSWRVREISQEGSLSVGYASEVLQSLVAQGYVAEKSEGFRLADPVSLLKDWSAAYRWEDNKIRSYVAPFGKDELVAVASRALESARVQWMATLLSAMDRLLPYVQHEQVHLYVDGFRQPLRDRLHSRLHAESVSRGGNLHIMEPYYGEAAWYGAQSVDGMELVSDIQLFLDLVHYPARGAEAADLLLRKRIAPTLHLRREQVRSLAEGVGL